MSAQLTVISLGWGVQSFTLAAMAALGELPPVDAAIHADTTHERQATYAFAAKWAPWLEVHGIKVITTTAQPMRLLTSPGTLIPAYTLAVKGATVEHGQVVAGGLESVELTQGQVRRQCTHDWKIAPLRRAVSTLLAERGLTKTPGIVEQWIGISLDEFQRMRTSDAQYITHRYPLTDQRMTRADCIAWLTAHDLEVPGKSACVFCPYHNDRAWQALKREGGADWQHAVETDAAIRGARPPFDVFVHKKCLPLDQAVVIPEDQGLVQGGLFDAPIDETAPCAIGCWH